MLANPTLAAAVTAGKVALLRLRSSGASGHRFCVTAMAEGTSTPAAVAAGPRRIILWFRNDLRLCDNVIVHQAVQKIKTQMYDEVIKANAAATSPSNTALVQA